MLCRACWFSGKWVLLLISLSCPLHHSLTSYDCSLPLTHHQNSLTVTPLSTTSCACIFTLELPLPLPLSFPPHSHHCRCHHLAALPLQHRDNYGSLLPHPC
ncbi:hypothetical protein AMTRI_Chr07g75760 [Amborella trichopoda]